MIRELTDGQTDRPTDRLTETDRQTDRPTVKRKMRGRRKRPALLKPIYLEIICLLPRKDEEERQMEEEGM